MMPNRGQKRSYPLMLVTGGCRSGKSAFAQHLAENNAPLGLYLATALVDDEEMNERIRLHQEIRGDRWRVYELAPGESLDLWQKLPNLPRPGEALLLDCLSLWVSGCMQGEVAPKNFPAICDRMLAALALLACPVIMVNNEVGMGIVPYTRAGRAFRDMAGLAAQKAATLATHVIFMVSGLPLAVKGNLPHLA